MQLNINDMMHFNLYYLYLDWLLLSSVTVVVLVKYNRLQPLTVAQRQNLVLNLIK